MWIELGHIFRDGENACLALELDSTRGIGRKLDLSGFRAESSYDILNGPPLLSCAIKGSRSAASPRSLVQERYARVPQRGNILARKKQGVLAVLAETAQ